MFSRDVRHYAPTPRRLSESKFGPDSRLDIAKPAWVDAGDMILALVGAVAIAAAIGFMLAWRG